MKSEFGFSGMAEGDIPAVYEIESVEQLRAIADDLRQRIISVLIEHPMTVTQVGERLGVAAARAHYHVRELERVALVRLVQTRERGGILEKYYRAVARDFNVPRALLHTMSPEDHLTVAGGFLHTISQAFMGALSRAVEADELGDERESLALTRNDVWLTRDEHQHVMEQLSEILKPFGARRGVAGEDEHTFVTISYRTPPPSPWEVAQLSRDGNDAPAPRKEGGRKWTGPTETSRLRRAMTAGALTVSRDYLEELRAEGALLDLTVFGYVHFADDVPADLVQQVVARFRHRGMLRARPEIREVLSAKGS